MRLSTNPDDAGYANWKRFIYKNGFPKVYLDGALFSDVLTADTDEGFIEIVKHGSDGKVVITYEGNVATTIRYGHVRIVHE